MTTNNDTPNPWRPIEELQAEEGWDKAHFLVSIKHTSVDLFRMVFFDCRLLDDGVWNSPCSLYQYFTFTLDGKVVEPDDWNNGSELKIIAWAPVIMELKAPWEVE